MECSFRIAIFFSVLLVTLQCDSSRDKKLVELYRDGIDYLQLTEARLRSAQNADEAATIIENSIPPLRMLVERKNKLEREYPELADTTKREQIHGRFSEFRELRIAAQSLYAYGSKLASKYKDHTRFRRASREGWEILAYF